MMGDSYVQVKAPATVQRLDKVTVARMRSSQSIATIAHAVEECTSLLQPQMQQPRHASSFLFLLPLHM